MCKQNKKPHEVQNIIYYYMFSAVSYTHLDVYKRQHQPQVGAAVGLGQAHGASPLAAGHLVQVGGFLRIGAMGVQGLSLIHI